ncbi:hypothetical protein [Sphingobacterium sp. BIGb0165]|uniref:hypothetical protein n=1 Tax=Sphingobacterium sp. BIGb0165 TaxID=2940615 RepID=UPI002169F3B1|nr:hypothetical protein [Sphingobacterium sp. BIGb0165]
MVLLLIHFSSYSQKLALPASLPVEEIRISPLDAFSGTASDLLTDVVYIELDKPKKGWVENFNRCYIIGDQLFLKDDQLEGSIWTYNLDGKFQSKFEIDNEKIRSNTLINNLDNAYFYLSDIDKLGEGKQEADGIKYSLKGEFIEQIPVRNQLIDQKLCYVDGMVKIGTTEYWYSNPYRALTRGDRTILHRRDHKGNISSVLKLDENNYSKDGLFSTIQFFTTFADRGSYLHYSNPLTYEVIEISEKGLEKKYQFILPLKNTGSLDLYKDKLFTSDRSMFYKRFPDVVMAISNVIRYGDYLIFSFVRGLSGQYAYNLQTGDLINLGSVIPDESNAFMPLFSSTNGSIFSDGTYLYSIVLSRDINRCIEDFYQHKELPERIKRMANSKNPILVKFKLK